MQDLTNVGTRVKIKGPSKLVIYPKGIKSVCARFNENQTNKCRQLSL